MSVIRSLIVKIGADLSDFQNKMRKAQKDLEKMSRDFKKVGDTLTKNVTLPIMAVGTALVGVTVNSAKAAGEILTMSAVTGLSTQKLQELQYASVMTGGEFNTISDTIKTLEKSMYEAFVNKNKDIIQGFQALGVEILNSDGTLKDAETVFYDVTDALGKMENPTLADATAMKLLGDNALNLKPVMDAGKEGIQGFADEAEKLGIVISEDKLEKLDDLNKKIATLALMFKAVGIEIASELEPVIGPIIDTMIEKLPEWRDKLVEVIDKFKELNPETKKFIGYSLGVAIVLGPAAAAIGIAGAALGVMTSSLGLAVLGIGLLAVGGYLIVKNWDMIKSNASIVWKDIANAILSPVNAVIDGLNALIMGANSVIDIVNDFIDLINKIPGINFSNWGHIGELGNINVSYGESIDVPDTAMSTITMGDYKSRSSVFNQPAPFMTEDSFFSEPTFMENATSIISPEAASEVMNTLTNENTIQVILDGKVIQEYIDKALGEQLSFGGTW